MANPIHVVFSLTNAAPNSGAVIFEVTCTCGAVGTLGSVRNAIDWYGAHCSNAALDRAVQILKS